MSSPDVDAHALMATRPAPRAKVITALGLMQIFTWGSSYYLLAVLAGPIAADTGWPLPWIFGALSAGLLVAGFASPWVGARIGRSGGRIVLAGGCALLALGLVIISQAWAFPLFIAGWLVLGLGMGASLYDAAFATLGQLYGASARPAITQLTLWGGFASTVCWPISAYLVAHVGWRETCLAYAALHLFGSVPMLLLALPRAIALPAASAAPAPAGPPVLTGPERMCLRLFSAILVLGGVTTATVSIHLLSLLQEQGLTLAAAVALGVLIGPSQVAARIVEMAGRGRHHPLWTLAAAVVCMAAGLGILAMGWGLQGAALMLYGAGNGVYSIARGTLPLALFGAARYAPLIGRLARPNLLAQALAPSVAAFCAARYGAGVMLDGLVAIALVNIGLMIALRRASLRL